MLTQTVGIVQGGALDDNHAAYLKGWMKTLKGDPTALSRAMTQATKASTWVLETAGMMADIEPPKDAKPTKKKATTKPKGSRKPKARKPKATPAPKARKPTKAPVAAPGGQLTLF